MRALLCILAVCCGVAGFSIRAFANDDYKVVGYSMNPASPAVYDHAVSHLTDLIAFSIEPGDNGGLNHRRFTDEMRIAISRLKRNHRFNAHIAVGGWGRSEHFASMSSTRSSRTRFIATLLNFCLKNKFSGVDYDWEHPKNSTEEKDYGQLIVETQIAFQPHGLTVTAAIAPWQTLTKAAVDSLDRIHLMAYDGGRKHSTLDYAQESIERALARGIPPRKLYLGVPFYGRLMENTEISKGYANILSEFSPKFDEDEAGGFYFNGPATIAQKVTLIKRYQLGGIMIWEISTDVAGDASLLEAISTQLRNLR